VAPVAPGNSDRQNLCTLQTVHIVPELPSVMENNPRPSLPSIWDNIDYLKALESIGTSGHGANAITLPSIRKNIEYVNELERARTPGYDANAITGQESQPPTVSPPERSRGPQQSQSVDQPKGEPNMLNIVRVHSH
jgi:hypothetical protein